MRSPFAVVVLLAALVTGRLDARPEPGTFSIVARDPETGELGVAVQSRAFNVGQAVPWARAGVGAIATQAWTNMSFGPRGLEMLAEGRDAADVLSALLESDDDRDARQLAVLDADGGTASWTGSECMDWAGGFRRDDLAAQGNILASEMVIDAMVRAFDDTEGTLAEKLLAALEGAQAAGGDKRGQQSAALLVVIESDRHPEYRERFVDLRVDDHPAPIAELHRLYRTSISTDLIEAYLELAEELAAAGDGAGAARRRSLVADAMTLVTEDPGASASELNALAWTIGTRDLFLEEARAAAARAVEMEPTAEVLDTLAEVQWRLGAYDAAVTTGARALELSPEDPYLAKQLEKYRASRAAGERVEPPATP
jgi:uncharacterized Ntn-hydrolase superfamily protein